MSIKMELELDEADARFLEDVALRTGTTVDESLHVLLCRAREEEPAAAKAAEPFEEPAGFSHLDYFLPIDPPGAVTDGALNHDKYLHEAKMAKRARKSS